MADVINLEVDYFDHIKTIRLVNRLGRGAEVLPIRLWCYCGGHHAESGRLNGYSPQEIETVILKWWGRSGEAVQALLDVGFLEKDGDTFVAHKWKERNGHIEAFKIRARNAANARWAKLRGESLSNATSNAQALPKQCSTVLPTERTTVQHEKKESKPETYEETQLKNIAPPKNAEAPVFGTANSQAPPKSQRRGQKPPATRPHWQEYVSHILDSFGTKKGLGRPYRPTQEEIGMLAGLYSAYTPETVMACWDMWWETGMPWSEWGARTGRSIKGFVEGIKTILDDYRWKIKRKAYEKRFGVDPESVGKIVKDALGMNIVKTTMGQ